MEKVSEVRARVRALDGGVATVEVQGGGCGRCHEEGGCGGHHLTQILCAAPRIYTIEEPGEAEIGEEVLVRISEGSLFWGATLAYVFPVLALLVGAWLGMAIYGDYAAMLGGGLGLVVVWLLVRHILRNGTGNLGFRPQIVACEFDSTKVRR